ncbi:MAG TPA: hypothetical protein VMU22_14540 [Rhizomicrobium sp.]|nr:hypothetical protein [Rhizomicrobium sp.]
MSPSRTIGVGRRRFLASALGLLGIAVAGGAVYEGTRLFGRRYPRTKFDDLLDQLPDRESAAKIGRAAMAEGGSFDAEALAGAFRHGPSRGSLSRAVNADIAAGRLTTVQGWLLPASLVEVSAIAASVQPAV